jgi:hypothetical protein
MEGDVGRRRRETGSLTGRIILYRLDINDKETHGLSHLLLF